jgi:hypothetical protein
MDTNKHMTDPEAFIALGDLLLDNFDPQDTMHGILSDKRVDAILTAQRALVERIARNTPIG